VVLWLAGRLAMSGLSRKISCAIKNDSLSKYNKIAMSVNFINEMVDHWFLPAVATILGE
jgi:hypothetical protein